jgi:hypothetical protein
MDPPGNRVVAARAARGLLRRDVVSSSVMDATPQSSSKDWSTCSRDMRFPGYDARSHRGLIRWELFLHRDVRDVLITPQADTLRVVYRGDPDLDGWAQTLTGAGFPKPCFDGGASGEIADSSDHAAA